MGFQAGSTACHSTIPFHFLRNKIPFYFTWVQNAERCSDHFFQPLLAQHKWILWNEKAVWLYCSTYPIFTWGYTSTSCHERTGTPGFCNLLPQAQYIQEWTLSCVATDHLLYGKHKKGSTSLQVNLKNLEVMYSNRFFEGLEFIWKMYEEQTESEHMQRNSLLS